MESGGGGKNSPSSVGESEIELRLKLATQRFCPHCLGSLEEKGEKVFCFACDKAYSPDEILKGAAK